MPNHDGDGVVHTEDDLKDSLQESKRGLLVLLEQPHRAISGTLLCAPILEYLWDRMDGSKGVQSHESWHRRQESVD
jgi:hypothetical protein